MLKLCLLLSLLLECLLLLFRLLLLLMVAKSAAPMAVALLLARGCARKWFGQAVLWSLRLRLWVVVVPLLPTLLLHPSTVEDTSFETRSSKP